MAQNSRHLTVYIHLGGGELYPTGGEWNHIAFPRMTLYNAVLGHLVVKTQKGEILPALLESWESSEGFSRWTLSLRPGIKFHDGRPVNSEDLAFSLKRHLLGPYDTVERESLQGISGVDRKNGIVEGLEVIDDHKIELLLKMPDPAFIKNLAISELSIVPREHLLGDSLNWKIHPIGAGPYQIVTASGGEVQLKRNENYPGVLEKAPQTIRIVTDFKHPEKIDLVVGTLEVPPETKDRLDQFVLEGVPAHIISVVFNYRSSLGADRSFRRAVSMAINREKLAGVFENAEAKTWLIPDFIDLGEAPADDYDPQAARELFEALGLSGEKGIALSKPDETDQKLLDRIKKHLAAAGLSTRFSDSPKSLFDPKDMETPFWIGRWSPDIGDALIIFEIFSTGSAYVPRFPENDSRYQELLQAAQSETNLEERKALIRQLALEFLNERRVVPLIVQPVVYLGCRKHLQSLSDSQQMQSLMFHRIEMH